MHSCQLRAPWLSTTVTHYAITIDKLRDCCSTQHVWNSEWLNVSFANQTPHRAGHTMPDIYRLPQLTENYLLTWTTHHQRHCWQLVITASYDFTVIYLLAFLTSDTLSTLQKNHYSLICWISCKVSVVSLAAGEDDTSLSRREPASLWQALWNRLSDHSTDSELNTEAAAQSMPAQNAVLESSQSRVTVVSAALKSKTPQVSAVMLTSLRHCWQLPVPGTEHCQSQHYLCCQQVGYDLKTKKKMKPSLDPEKWIQQLDPGLQMTLQVHLILNAATQLHQLERVLVEICQPCVISNLQSYNYLKLYIHCVRKNMWPHFRW